MKAPVDENPRLSVSALEDFFHKHPSIEFIRYQWVDLSGILRTRILPKEQTLKLALQNDGALRCSPVTLQSLVDLSYMPDWDAQSGAVHRLCPDWSSLRPLAGGETTSLYATVMCCILEETCPSGEENWICPRYALSNVFRVAEERFGLRFLVGFEIEFVILQPSDDPEQGFPLCNPLSHRYAVAGMRDSTFRHVEKSVRNLIAAGVQIHDFHPEGASGQYENSLAPLPPMEAADEIVRAHDIIKTTVAAEGYIATMIPRPRLARQSNGEHIHISLQSNDSQHTEESFLAGLLRWISAICAVTLPYPQSYCRVTKREAGDRAAWGTENRDVAVRKIKTSHWEIRCADATANMYLALASLLAAGLEGVEQQRPLTLEDASISNADQLVDPLPTTLGDALELLKRSVDGLEPSLGSNLIPQYVKLKQVESERIAALTPGTLETFMTTLF